MKYAIQFTGKRKGSIGIYYPILAELEANSQALAVLSLYDTYEPFEINDIYEVDQETMLSFTVCNHTGGYNPQQYGWVALMPVGSCIEEKFNYCPECGIKLEKDHVEG